MGEFIQPSPSVQEDSGWRPIILGVGLTLLVVAVLAFFLRPAPKSAQMIHPYSAYVKLSDLKLSRAENFVGANVTYVDGTITNAGEKIISHATVHVEFRNSLNEVAQSEDVSLHVLQQTGPYLDTVDLKLSPLGPGQRRPFRLTFEHVTTDWNQAYPDLKVTDVTFK